MRDVQALLQDYRVAFLRYLPHRDEAALARGYEIGRDAVVEGMSVLHLTQVHHAVLAEVMASAPAEEQPRIVATAAEFLMEVLAPFDMAQRTRQDRPDASTPGA